MSDINVIPVERHPLEPFLPPNARLLMLGSFPPPRKRWSMDFFYPNRTNMMWEIFGEVFFGDSQRLVDAERRTFRLADIKSLLLESGIALYDTASAVRRLSGNASDKDLEIVEKTDIAAPVRRVSLFLRKTTVSPCRRWELATSLKSPADRCGCGACLRRRVPTLCR